MANQEQLRILKQGSKVWNKWREENPNVKIDLCHADLGGIYLWGADLSQANLSEADISRVNLTMANLSESNLSQAEFIRANLAATNIWKANLTKANLSEADLGGADLWRSDLGEANLCGADLRETNLFGVHLKRSNFSQAVVSDTMFVNLDLSEPIELENVVHVGPSTVGADTLAQSNGKIPEIFLRSCGLSDWEIESAKLYDPTLDNEEINKALYKIYDLRAAQALQISPLFISYSHCDGVFVDKLEEYLNSTGVRFWRDIHDMKAGRIERQIDHAIELNRTVLLILSKHSLQSDWVEHEVRKARQLEKKAKRDILCPIALDKSWKKSRWPERIMEQIMEYNILDFSAWEDNGEFETIFKKLIGGLDLFYR